MHLIVYCISIFRITNKRGKNKTKMLKCNYYSAFLPSHLSVFLSEKQIYLFLLKMIITTSGVLFNILQEIWKHFHWKQKKCRIYQWKFRIKYLKSWKRVIFKIFERKCKKMENQKERKKIYIMDKGFFSNLYQISWKESLR